MRGTEGRPLSEGERKLVRSVFGNSIDCDPVRIHSRKWFPFQPRNVMMAPDGHVWVPPAGNLWHDDYADAPINLQGLLLHEMTHVLQAQERGRYYLVLMRHPFCRYRYRYRPGKRFDHYGLEQQAEIVRHLFLQRHGWTADGAAPLAALERLVPFGPAGTTAPALSKDDRRL